MVEINNTTKYKVNLKKIAKIVTEFLRIYKLSDREVSVALIGARRMRQLNKKYRDQDNPTDVLSFLAINSSGVILPFSSRKFLGEVVINISEIKKFNKYRKMFKEIGITEKNKINSSQYLFYFLLIHGLLHLIGYEDKRKKERIKILELGKNFLTENL